MRQTPRSLRAHRGMGTLIGNGWLNESPRNFWSLKWARSKSALRRCMLMPVPDEIRNLPMFSSPPLPPPPSRPLAAQDVQPHRHAPERDVRMLPAMPAMMPVAGGLLAPRAAPHAPPPKHVPKHAHRTPREKAWRVEPRAWWEDPVALGSLLILLPPIGLAAVWSSKRYSNEARWALTVMTGLTMCIVTTLIVAVLALR